jgi:crotonobetainyl-CoA:carnitine CoA-transferase CaiB-like acyl-CoA transferase
MDESPVPSPLEGVRILAVEHMLALPYATQLLGLLGADVVKVEPLDGESGRASRPLLGEPPHQLGAVFARSAAGKRSIAIDLKNPRGRDLLLALVARFDVVAENLRAGVFARLGFDFDTLVAANPRVILATVSGYGHLGDSPYRHWPAFGPLVEGTAGLNTLGRASDEDPVPLGSYGALGDIMAGVFTALGIMTAMRQRDLSGQSQHVDIAMFDTAMTIMDAAPLIAARGFPPSAAVGGGAGLTGTFRAKSGHFTLWVVREHMFQRLAQCIGRTEWLADPAFTRREQWGARLESDIRPAIEAWAADKDNYAAADELARSGVPAGLLQTAEDLLSDEHVRRRQMLIEVSDQETGEVWPVIGNPVKLAGRTEATHGRVPSIGEHTQAILSQELGLSATEIVSLSDEGVIASRP